MAQALYPHEYLAEMLVPEYPNVYVLGCFAKYATIYAQQVRGINLVDSLCRTGQMACGTKVAIIGAAASGLTAAVAATLRGATVEVFEKEGVLFPIQRNPGKRFLHPHVYDWPVGEMLVPDAGLPILNWRADDAPSVFASIERQWEEACAKLGIAPVRRNTELTGIEIRGRRPVLTFKGERAGEFPFDLVILAIGFGAEIDRADLQRYWQSDPLDATLTGTILVSGDGDGALTDIMRLCIQDFHHDEIVARFLEYDDIAEPLKKLLLSNDNVKVAEVFSSVWAKTSFTFGSKIKFREGLNVYLNAPADYLESSRTAILNRLIAFLLEREKRFERKSGNLRYPIPVQTMVDGKLSFVVELESEQKVEQVVCQRLLIRHGPERFPGDKKMPKHWTALRAIWDTCATVRDRWHLKSQGTDSTMIPLYAPPDYDLVNPRPVVRPTAIRPASRVKLRCLILGSSSSEPDGGFLKHMLEAHREALGRATGTVLSTNEIATESLNVNTAIEDSSSFGAAIAALSAADLAFVDVTGFEAGVMLLLGIRSVLRPGVTLMTTREKFEAHHWSLLPFNLKEMYPLCIKPETDSLDSPAHPFQWLGVTVADALTERRSVPQYLDSPAHDNVRRLGPTVTYFGRVTVKNGILWLCPFAESYMKGLGAMVQLAIKDGFGLTTKLQRITDIVSPQLVSQRLYSAMRRRDLCVVDWTTWSANVFYELGVRLAVNRFATICILGPVEERTEQQRRLIKLLGPIEYGFNGAGLETIRQRYEQILNHVTSPESIPPAWGDGQFDSVYRLIAELTEPFTAATGPVEELLQAQAAVRLPSTTDFSSPVLYADANDALKQAEEAVALEMLLAAWFYLSERAGLKEIKPTPVVDPVYEERLKAYWNLGDRTAGALAKSTLEQDRKLAVEMQERVDGQRKAHRKLKRVGGKPNVGIE